MYWFRTKTILIILFFCINIFLLVNMIVSTNKSIIVDSDTIDNTLKILNKNDISVDRELLLKKIKNYPAKLQIENTLINMDLIAESLFVGKEYIKSEQTDKTYKFTYEDKVLKVKGSYFEYNEPVQNNLFTVGDERVKDYMKSFVKKLGVNSENIYFKEITKTDNGYFIVCNYKYKDSKIFGPDIKAEIGNTVHIEGYAVNPVGVSDEKVSVTHITGILIKFLSEEKINEPDNITVTDISLGYRIEEENLKNEIKELKVAPVWQIITGSNNIYYYKALK